MKITIGQYLLGRLQELGISHIFGVPGDYNLSFLDQILEQKGLQWVGTCNELNGAYASDGYARIKGAGALVTTYGVGELSAINGIAGAYAEYANVVHIVGMPSTSVQARKAIVHHTLGSGDFGVFIQMYSPVTVAQTVLTEFNAAKEIDRVLTEGWLKKRPVYIGIPSGISYKKIDAPEQKLDLSYPASPQDAVTEAATRITKLLEKAKHPIILADICAVRHPMGPLIEDFLAKTGIPFATMNMGKGIIRESHPQYMGSYNGVLSATGVQEQVENSDCILSFGSVMSDFNTGGFTSSLDINSTIEIHSNYVKLKHSIYNNMYFQDIIPALLNRLTDYQRQHTHVKKHTAPTYHAENKAVTQDRFWQRMTSFITNNSIVAAEAGTCLFGALEMSLPDGCTFVAQTLWASIGYTLGAILGTNLAAPKRQTILFIGDGSFQLTAQEVSTMIRHHLTPIIFLINNDGYTVERAIHGPTAEYNDIKMWDYAKLPHIFGDNVFSTKVTTELELEKALSETKENQHKLNFIEVVMDKNDSPEILQKIAKACAEQNRG